MEIQNIIHVDDQCSFEGASFVPLLVMYMNRLIRGSMVRISVCFVHYSYLPHNTLLCRRLANFRRISTTGFAPLVLGYLLVIFAVGGKIWSSLGILLCWLCPLWCGVWW